MSMITTYEMYMIHIWQEAMLLQLEGLRQEWEVMMVDEARAEDEALERKQRQATPNTRHPTPNT